jgi:aspartyl-tRNA(Asn)/glutamyl-tRNA(Gln) amidotransferase subunit C
MHIDWWRFIASNRASFADPMSIDRKQIDHVAKLASLTLTDAEAEKLTAELAAIVRYVEELRAVDTDGIEPTAAVLLGSARWRADKVAAGVERAEVLAQAPESGHDGFVVPTFVEQ